MSTGASSRASKRAARRLAEFGRSCCGVSKASRSERSRFPDHFPSRFPSEPAKQRVPNFTGVHAVCSPNPRCHRNRWYRTFVQHVMNVEPSKIASHFASLLDMLRISGTYFAFASRSIVSRHMALRYMLGMWPQLDYQCPLKAAEAHEKPVKVKSLAQSPYQTPCLDRFYSSVLGINLLRPIADARM